MVCASDEFDAEGVVMGLRVEEGVVEEGEGTVGVREKGERSGGGREEGGGEGRTDGGKLGMLRRSTAALRLVSPRPP